MDNTVASTGPEKTRGWKERVRSFFRILALASSAIGACYLGGFLHGRSGLNQVQAQLDTERATAKQTAEHFAKQLDEAKRQILALDARRSLDLAVAALDARNFGIAEQQVRKAGQWLKTVSTETRWGELGSTLEGFHLTATEDLGPQRRQLVEWIAQLDQRIVTSSTKQ